MATTSPAGKRLATRDRSAFSMGTPVRNHTVAPLTAEDGVARIVMGLGRGIPTIIKIMGERVRFEELGGQFRVTLMLECSGSAVFRSVM